MSKRPGADLDNDLQQPAKKHRASELRRHQIRHKQAGYEFPLLAPQDTSNVVYIDGASNIRASEALQDGSNVSDQLRKALCVALVESGFMAATDVALESFSLCVREYLQRLTSIVKQFAQQSRRMTILPGDFELALKQFGLTTSSLRQQLKSRIPPSISLPDIEPPLPADEPPEDLKSLFQTGTEALALPLRKKYVPAHFPVLPSRHTYSATPVFTERETDPREIRERAMQEGMQAETALRKLMAAKKADARAQIVKARQKAHNPQWLKNEQIWKETMEAALRENEGLSRDGVDIEMGPDGNDERIQAAPIDVDALYGATVNYDRIHWRQAARGDTLTA